VLKPGAITGPRGVQTSTVKKSVAAITFQYAFKNDTHEVRFSRSAAGSIPCLFRIFLTVFGAMM